MKIVRLIGGLGNQMFQYALYLSLLERGYEAKIDINQLSTYKLHNGFELNKVFNVLPQFCSYKTIKKVSLNRKSELLTFLFRKVFKKLKSEYIEKQFFIYDSNVFSLNDNIYIQGYWQNEKYFKNIQDKILNEFSFKKELSPKNKELLLNIVNSDSVSIHVRRGDYLKDNLRNSICNIDYYLKAIKLIKSKIKDPFFYVFSDDIEWCKLNINEDHCYYIDWNFGNNSCFDMQLMSNCKHNIISNSSFSWWAAWLNQNPKKYVISPSKWIDSDINMDIIPKNWIKI